MNNYVKSSYCGTNACVEVAQAGNSVFIRDNEKPDKIIEFTLPEWAAFLAGVKNNEFDIKFPRAGN
jgi:hypothetical protein